MKNKEKGIGNDSKKEEEINPNRKSWNCLDCDANRKWIQKSNQNNNYTDGYPIKLHSDYIINRVEVKQALQYT